MNRIPLVFSLAALALAACSPDTATSPRAPLAAKFARGASELPFRGKFELRSQAVRTPTTLQITGMGEGTATHLGRFELAMTELVVRATTQATGTLVFTAANGDQLFTTITGSQTGFVPPNVAQGTFVATIVGGTGRLAAATGTFTVQWSEVIDFATGTGVWTAAFDGDINLGK